MELAVDTNVLMSALIKSAKSRELLCSPEIKLYAPERVILETLAHKKDIVSKSKITEEDFSVLMKFLVSKVSILPNGEIQPFMKQALTLVTHEEDAPFMAVALLKKIPLWSNDAALKKQSVVKVISTSEFLKEL